ncbi:Hypothetical predicted protein, partial [Paramuricea clavata]
MVVLSEYCTLRMREDGIDERYSETGPSNLPRTDMLKLLTKIIQSHPDPIKASKIQ